jgi:hypothetical protein
LEKSLWKAATGVSTPVTDSTPTIPLGHDRRSLTRLSASRTAVLMNSPPMNDQRDQTEANLRLHVD